MATAGGPNIVSDDSLVFSTDGASRRSTLRFTQTSNILLDPGQWTTGTGNYGPYYSNGSSTEQNRLYVDDDPWGRRSVTWRTAPDAVSGADGGWNSGYYAIDRNFTYRYSVWVRRYTTGTGGTFYLGTNPAPLRNDNGASQGNPYWHCPPISSLTYNQWYLVVAHCFYEGYTGGRHPESGYWYKDGNGDIQKTDLGFCNCGSEDVRWPSGTTTSMHRAYHFYTTNTASGIEFAYPRVDKMDGKEPTIQELLTTGESGWVNIPGKGSIVGNLYNGVSYINDGELSTFDFDGTDDYIDVSSDLGVLSAYTFEYVAYTTTNNKMPVSSRTTTNFYKYGANSWRYTHGGVGGEFYHNTGTSNGWSHWAVTYNGATIEVFQNGVSLGTQSSTGTADFTSGIKIGSWASSASYTWNGKIPVMKVYSRGLTSTEVQSNYNAYKNRFNL